MEAEIDFDQLFSEKGEEYRKRVVAKRDERLAAIPETSLIWHALVPAWTLPLAAASGFPTGEHSDPNQIFQQMEKMGYSFSSQTKFTDGIKSDAATTIFAMPADKRAEVLQKAALEPGLPALRRESKKISRKFLEIEKSVLLPSSTARWAQLVARAGNSYEFADFFDTLTDDLFQAGKSGEMLEWIETGRSLEQFFGSDLSYALGRAARRLELFHRRAGDRRRLTRFLERAEQIAAVRDLFENKAGEWALHFIGAGGVGKTMLIRHLTANLSKIITTNQLRETNFAIARVDFDYLNPDYPARAPGLLLAQLAEEFRVYAPNQSVIALLSRFNDKIANLHDHFRIVPEGFSLESAIEPVLGALPMFAEALSLMGQSPVIILDTCEELLKIRIDGKVPPSVEVTFQLLERLHEQIDSLRVVFGGRRPLASGGAGWTVPGSHLPNRQYLRVHEIRGFTRDESEKYLGEIERVSKEAIEPIIKLSAEQIKNSRIVWNSVETQRLSEQQRYNPFDLWLYASWLHEDSNLPLGVLEKANAESYVEMRIVNRIENAHLRSLLPFVSLLGRFDAKSLQVMSNFDEAHFGEVFAELSNLEWVSHQTGQTFEVERGLQPRLLSYFEKRAPGEFRQARRKLVDFLENQTLTAPRTELNLSDFLTAFRLLKIEPERALAWWRKMEIRFASEQACDWLKTACESILGEEKNESLFDLKTPELALPDALLLAAIYASYAATMLQTHSFSEIEQVWGKAVSILEKYQAEEKAKYLLRRARAGRLAAAARFNPTSASDQEIELFWQTLGELRADELDFQLAGSLIAAAESITEFLETRQGGISSGFSALKNFAACLETSKECGHLVSFTNALCGRLLILAGAKSAGLDVLRSALPLKTNKSGSPVITAQTFLDWLAPAQIEFRIQLEFARLAYPEIGAAEILQLIGDRIPEPVTIDAERLGSAILTYQAAVGGGNGGSAPKDTNDLYARQNRYFVSHEPLCRAHHAFQPLFASVAEAIAATGRVDQAIEMLQETASEADESSASQLGTVQEAERALLHIIRRMRLRDENYGVETSLNRSDKLPDIEILAIIRGLSNPKQNLFSANNAVPLSALGNAEDGLMLVHDLYRASLIESAEAARSVAELLGRVVRDGSVANIKTYAEMSCFLDCLEINEKYESFGLNKPFPQFRTEQVGEIKYWQETLQTVSLEKLTLLLRLTAQDDKRIIHDAGADKNLLVKIGRRRAACIALEEGELLSLRFPEKAIRLLNFAHKLFVQAKDDIGSMIARICAALALGRAGDNVTLGITLSKIKHAYTRHFAESAPKLPAWNNIMAAAENPVAGVLDRLSPRGWRPWLVRLIVCLAWEKDGYRAGGRTLQITRWLEENYGVTTNDETTLPAELDDWLNTKRRRIKANENELSLAVSLSGNPSSWQALEKLSRANLEIRGAGQEFHQQFSVRGHSPYRQVAPELTETLRKMNFTFLQFLNEQKSINLQVEAQASWICWEAVLGLALQDLSVNKSHLPLFRRTIRGARNKPLEAWNNVRGVITWTNISEAAEHAQGVWQTPPENDLRRWGDAAGARFDYQIVDSERLQTLRQTVNQPQILHVVGIPTETSAGIRMNMSRDFFDSMRNAWDPSVKMHDPLRLYSSMEAFENTTKRGELLKAEQLVSRFPQMAACILQAPPREATGGRSSYDREQAAYLRLLGAEVSRLGVPVVITIPSFEPILYVRVLYRLVHGFRLLQISGGSTKISTEDVAEMMLDEIERAREIIVKSEWADADDLLEMALDICLYSADAKR